MCCEALGSCYLLCRGRQIHPSIDDTVSLLISCISNSQALRVDLSWMCSNIDECGMLKIMLVCLNSTLGTRIAAAILRYRVKTSLSLFDNNSE